ncbi:T9SS type A sorting domain-containing protein [Sunxiuqinia sp. A32]|uniref:T9SS type A sorting domain-containing protein n=1 Tax=Sunxiuqinia sp. A32 TaxID=3461496 RepID=UPI0040453525
MDVSNNPALTYLSCLSNQLTSLDVSNNPALTSLLCISNQLASLDVSNNPALTSLRCDNNQLMSLDVKNSTVLTRLDCGFNQLIALDVSNNPALKSLRCNNNQLRSLDVSNNPALISLKCNNNQLTSLNLRNGNNTTMWADTTFQTINNPNLYCIQVDDIDYSMANWSSSSFDPWTSFGEDCLYDIDYPNSISGKVLKDIDCNIDDMPQGIQNIIVKTEPSNFYGITDSLGYYTISADTGNYHVTQVLNDPLINPICPMPNYHSVYFESLEQDTSGLNFFNAIAACPYLTVEITSNRRRRCFKSHTYVRYCNKGYADATGVEVHVQLPEYVHLLSADQAYTVDADGSFLFNIGDLAQGECSQIHIVDSVSCEEGITGLTQCTRAWILPSNDCAESLEPNINQWDKSTVTVKGGCVGDTVVQFVISNSGEYGVGDMDIASEYRIYADNELVHTDIFQLFGGEEMIVEVPANGQTIRLEADQHPMYPGNSHPRETIEACGDVEEAISLGFVNAAPMDDADVNVEIDCIEIRDSYDPNDKSVSPQGVTENNYLMLGTPLDYLIRFQNTGSDTAYTIVVVDSLSANLDISTIEWGASSHPYTLNVSGYGKPVLKFTFNNVNLPDSTTDEVNSHGFVKFKIAPYNNIPMETEINNAADIYFDYNLPVRTNTAHVTISDTVLIGDLINVKIITDITEDKLLNYQLMPNPFSNHIDIVFDKYSNYDIKIFDLLGNQILTKTTRGRQYSLSTSELPRGVYLLQIKSDEVTRVKKMIKQ